MMIFNLIAVYYTKFYITVLFLFLKKNPIHQSARASDRALMMDSLFFYYSLFSLPEREKILEGLFS